MVGSLERDNLVVFYSLNASEIWPDKRGGIIYKRGTIVQIQCNSKEIQYQGTMYIYIRRQLSKEFSHHDKHRSSGPRPVKLCSDQ